MKFGVMYLFIYFLGRFYVIYLVDIYVVFFIVLSIGDIVVSKLFYGVYILVEESR